MNLKIAIYLFATAISMCMFSCQTESSSTPDVNMQGLFEFPDELLGDDGDDFPDFLDPETILCNGKGLKVGKCISKQLKKGICLGLVKHHKRVYAIEIPCVDIKKDTLESIELPTLTK